MSCSKLACLEAEHQDRLLAWKSCLRIQKYSRIQIQSDDTLRTHLQFVHYIFCLIQGTICQIIIHKSAAMIKIHGDPVLKTCIQNFIVKRAVKVINHQVKHKWKISRIPTKCMTSHFSKWGSLYHMKQSDDETFFSIKNMSRSSSECAWNPSWPVKMSQIMGGQANQM